MNYNTGEPVEYRAGDIHERVHKSASKTSRDDKWKVSHVGTYFKKKAVFAFKWIKNRNDWAKTPTFMEYYSPEKGDSFTGGNPVKNRKPNPDSLTEGRKVYETRRLTFKEYLIESTAKERAALIPPVAVQKLYADIKKQHGVVKRDVFYNKLADRLNLTPEGLRKLQRLPALRALPFDDQSQAEKPLVTRRDPFAHVSQKASQREQRARQAGIS